MLIIKSEVPSHMFHPKKLHATHSNMQGTIKTHTCLSQGLSFERLGRSLIVTLQITSNNVK
uniref:hypothetical protein n=1 Tax=Acinetobacter baumannii TaxID=470 RepID=UPI0033920368